MNVRASSERVRVPALPARRHSWKPGLLGLVFLASAPSLPAQQYAFRLFGLDQGLANLSVNAVFQDRSGFLWVGTEDGVFRFDGARFQRFGPAEGLPRTLSPSIGEAPDGSVLVLSQGGLARFDGDRFLPVKLPGAAAVDTRQGIFYDGSSQTYVVSDHGLVAVTAKPGSGLQLRLLPAPAPAPPKDSPFAALFFDRGALWFRCGQSLCRLDGDNLARFGEDQGLPSANWTAVLRDGQGDLWAVSRNELAVLHRGAERFEKATRDVPAERFGLAMALDRQGRLLLPVSSGLAIRDAGRFLVVGPAAGLVPPVFAVLQDREGSVWLALPGRGLARWQGYGEWESFKEETGLSSLDVLAVLPVGDGVWAGTSGGLFRGRFHSGSWTWERVKSVPGVPVRALRPASGGRLWLGTEGRGVASFDPSIGRTTWFGDSQGLLADVVFAFESDPSGRLLVATESGLFASNSSLDAFSRVQDLPASRVSSLAASPAGDLWAGASDGLYHLSEGRWQRITRAGGLLEDDIAAVASPRPGEIWVAYQESSSLTRIQSDGREWRTNHFAREDVLPGALVRSLAAPATGGLYAATGQGLLFFDGKDWSAFDHGDGLVSDDCNPNALALAPDGSVWIGTASGLSRFRPAAPPAPRAPAVAFSSLHLGRTPFSSAAEAVVDARSNTLVARFAALSFLHPDALRFRYRLSPLFQEWTETDLREVEFPSLPPGSYRFAVAARGPSGRWSDPPASFAFVVRPAWWQSWWLRALLVLLPLALTAYLLYIRFRREAGSRRLVEALLEQRDAQLREQAAELQRQVALLAGERERTQAAVRAEGELLAYVAGEIRAALNSILAAARLEASPPVSAGEPPLHAIRSAAGSLRGLLDDLLDLSRIESGRLELRSEPFAVAHTVGGACRLFLPEASRKGLALTWSLAPRTPEYVVGDGDRLRQVLAILIANAIRFTPSGSIAIGISARPLDGDVLELDCAVLDTGAGLPELHRGALDQSGAPGSGPAFSRADGTGIGLTIASRLVALMGGRLAAESSPGAGSAFRFTVRVHAATLIYSIHPPARPGDAVAPRRVLLVEDNPVSQRVATALLSQRGHPVAVAEDGLSAVARASAEGFDVILIDIQMPDIDGFETARRIRASEAGSDRRVPIVAMSARTGESVHRECAASGIDGVIRKPFQAEALFAVVESASPAVAPPEAPAPAGPYSPGIRS